MYRVKLMSAQGEVLKRHIFNEPPKQSDLQDILRGKKMDECWVDIERIPPDTNEYQRERECEYEIGHE